MRILKNILYFVAVAVAALGCGGTVDDSTLPVLEPSAGEIDLASESGVSLKVTFEGVDVTADSEIFVSGSVTPVGNFFAPEEPGTYSLHAIYDGRQSETVDVNVINTMQNLESRYERQVCLMEFTGAWCINCPDGYSKMMMILSKPSMAKYNENIHICAFHSNMEGGDALAIDATQDVFKLFKGLSYPSFVTDLRNVEGQYGVLTDDGSANLQPSIEASFKDYPAHCGVAVSSDLNDAKTEAAVSVKVTSELTSEYRVVLLVVEDKVLAPETPQKSPLYSNGDPDYVHKHAVRQVATTYKGTFTGEKVTDDGKIKAGEEAGKTWNVRIDSKWNLDNTEIYALVLDRNGYVNNMNVCHIADGKSDYILKK